MSPRNPVPIESLLLPLKPDSLQCLHRFMQYERKVPPHPVPKKRKASVAIILFVGRKGDLYVILTTRSGDLRTYAYDTALPGGKWEEGDKDEEWTARREAFEEIGLPMDTERVRCLTLLDYVIAGNQLVVTPVVLLCIDRNINPVLNPDEVVHLFSMPLAAFLHDRPADIPGWNFGLADKVNPVPPGLIKPPPIPMYANQPENEDEGVGGREGRFYQYRDIDWGGGPVRMHRFLTGREGGGVRPVYGLTAGILINAAKTGFGQEPTFGEFAPGQMDMEDRLRFQIVSQGGQLRRAVEAEGMMGPWMEDEARARARVKEAKL
ncbi:hypothetical protein CC85DRAFT_289453 [Cutaneotrichosporon oleaginosum]|uniref:Nudix hydrolase domain-containing protein n=1 Tax=Cutaneotrichosporon oleaginosum TaxID=879819 RepID=A0A0J0XBQ9_9TREE|nr:uncharacterized protein CC85DRAFT_289453 [Cutaneotrichosporon oleaginosum]KLT38505.1 hypothetical protein CC85DRAFT_289453 [Cutaneotrichosporon oleaginosum]TXT12303.1 hypothetical protein COLE_02713 [Cutaneotrichosporon oleaginosum]